MESFKEKSIPAMFHKQVARYGDKACVAYKKNGAYVDISWNDMGSMIWKIGDYLIDLGAQKGERIAIFSPNRFEWWVADQAILSIAAVDVPIYATNSSEEAQYILEHSESTICFVATADHLGRVLKAADSLPLLKKIIIFDDIESDDKRVISFKKALESAHDQRHRDEIARRLGSIGHDDLATLIYTSGTTGNPKGVMLTHGNFCSNVDQVQDAIKAVLDRHNPEDFVLLSFLPLSHSFERTCGYYMPVSIGSKVAFAEDFSTVVQNMNEVHPHIIISVPRLYEKIHAAVVAGVAKSTGAKKAIANFAIRTAKKNLSHVCNGTRAGGLLGFKVNLADKLVFSKLKSGLGMDRIIFSSSGGGPLAVSDAEFFIGMGIPITDGYGLTETTPVVATNRLGILKPGSVGPALKDTDIKISDEGEILIKGPQVMKGYYKNPEATAGAMTSDGYFKTGDIGMFDDRARLHITGRIKDIIVTSGGKNISPQNIENDLKESAFIEQAAIIGDRRNYLSALIVPAFDSLKQWAQSQNISASDNKSLLANEAVRKRYEEIINKVMDKYSRAEQIRKFTLLDAEWTQESGELTPTLKVKRRVIESKYAAEIEAMYPANLN